MSWQLLTAVSVITGSILVLLQRVLLYQDKSDPIAFVVVSQGITAVLLTVYALVRGFHLPDFATYGLPITAMFVLYSAGHIVYANTLQRVEASVFSTLLATSTIWVMLMGFLVFQESPSIEQLPGALLIFASVGMLAERSGKLKLDQGLLMGLLTGLIFGFASAARVYVGKHADAASWVALSFAGTPLMVLLINPQSVTKMKPFFSGGILIRLALLGILFGVSNVTGLLAFLFLHERTHLWQKAIAATLCFVGVLLIV